MTGHIKGDIAQRLHGLWEGLPRRKGYDLPFWQDMKSSHLLPVMTHAWALEYVPPKAMIVRFMGSEVGRWAGQDTTGKDFLTTRVAPEMREKTMAIYRTTKETPCGTQLTRLISLPGHNLKEMRTTFFPILFNETEGWGLLGCSDIQSSEAIIQLEGTADFAGSKLLAPNYIDIGFGCPATAMAID